MQSMKMALPSILPFISTPLPDKINIRYAVDSEAILFANNLEKDDAYLKWPKSVNDVRRRHLCDMF